ncbi:MAG: DUF1648 domain-containing protein [Candidatus Doudnabacteria bacterium]|nr:DUF1648 domain-containing protein [Candidatus Doudnabacteria bacterium]
MPYPLKLSIKTEAVPVILLIAAWLLALFFYAHFPAQVTSHWDMQGQPNGYMGRVGGAYALPGILTGMY